MRRPEHSKEPSGEFTSPSPTGLVMVFFCTFNSLRTGRTKRPMLCV